MTRRAPSLHDDPVVDSGSQQPPAAARSRGPGWRDPRLWIGVVILAASVLAGARLFASVDDTVAVWSVAAQHGAGDRLEADDLVAVRVRFADAGTRAGYVGVDDALPADLVLGRGVEAGELLPRAAVGSGDDSGLVQVPIAVEPEQVPGSVAAGSVVDVYLVAPSAEVAAGQQDGAVQQQVAGSAAAPALAGVTVLDAPALADSFGTTGKRQLVLAVPEAETAAFFTMLGATQSPVITVVRRG